MTYGLVFLLGATFGVLLMGIIIGGKDKWK